MLARPANTCFHRTAGFAVRTVKRQGVGRREELLETLLLLDREDLEKEVVAMTLEAQHCLSIAAVFIAIIAACATLINSANSKADSLANRMREATREHRERRDSARCRQLLLQLQLFKNRYTRVQEAQRLLFFTIGIFITSLTIFIGIGLYLLAGGIADVLISSVVIGSCVLVGTACMLKAIYLQYFEVGESFKTLCIETSDCEEQEGTVTQQTASVTQSLAELAG